MPLRPLLRLSVSLLVALAVAGCGGGGSAVTAPTTGLTGLNDFVLGSRDTLIGKFGDQIKGESKLDKYKDWTELNALSFGSSTPFNLGAGSGAAGIGKVNFDRIQLTKNVDSASLPLAKLNWTGQLLDKVALVVVSTSGPGAEPDKGGEVYRFDLDKVWVTAFSQSLVADDTGQESLDLAFLKIQITYTPLDKTGKPVTPIVVGWNVAENKPTRAQLQSVGLLGN